MIALLIAAAAVVSVASAGLVVYARRSALTHAALRAADLDHPRDLLS